MLRLLEDFFSTTLRLIQDHFKSSIKLLQESLNLQDYQNIVSKNFFQLYQSTSYLTYPPTQLGIFYSYWKGWYLVLSASQNNKTTHETN